MSNTTLPVSVRARIVQIERDHAAPNFHTVNHYWRVEGLAYKDAMHAEELERDLDRYDALASSVGLSELQREERSQVKAELDRFVRTAKRHAEKQRAKKQRVKQGQSLQSRKGRLSAAPAAPALR